MCVQVLKFQTHMNTYVYLCTMATPWEIDPTGPADRDGAGAGAMGGDSAGDSTLPPPLQPSEGIDSTNPFQPTRSTSTPYPPPYDDGETIEMTHMGDENDDESDDENIPLLTGFRNESERTKLEAVLKRIKAKFPRVLFYKLGPIGFGHKPENEGIVVSFGPGKKMGDKTFYVETRIEKQDGSG